MYIIYIENRIVYFVEQGKSDSLPNNLVEIISDEISLDELLNLCRNTSETVGLYCVSNDPERTIMSIFKSVKFVEACGGIVKRKNKYLFIKRHDVWDLPKGKMETGEQPEQTAVREIEEECGIQNPVINHLIGHTFHTYTFKEEFTLKKNWWFALDYTGPKKGVPQLEEGITEMKWLKKEEWDKVRKNTYPSIIEVLDKFQIAQN